MHIKHYIIRTLCIDSLLCNASLYATRSSIPYILVLYMQTCLYYVVLYMQTWSRLARAGLNIGSSDQSYVKFSNNGQTCGDISTAKNGGVMMTSTSGDFAEWHEKIEHNETLREGDVVGFRDGRVGLATAGCRILGVISERPVVLGSVRPNRNKDHFAVVAYCGRVPVNVQGPVRSGDLLVPSGRDDGTAIALKQTDTEDGLNCHVNACEASWATQDASHDVKACLGAIAVAMEASAGEDMALIQSVVTPPAMTREVAMNLRGRSSAGTTRAVFRAALVTTWDSKYSRGPYNFCSRIPNNTCILA